MLSRLLRVCAPALVAAVLVPAEAGAAEDRDARRGAQEPTAAQRQAAQDLGATVRWNRFGTARSVIADEGWLGARVQAPTGADTARTWVADHGVLFRLSSADGLRVLTDDKLAGTDARAVVIPPAVRRAARRHRRRADGRPHRLERRRLAGGLRVLERDRRPGAARRPAVVRG